MARPEDRKVGLSSTDRAFNLSDGVFSIAMTLLVFGLAVPVMTPDGPPLSVLLLSMWPEFLLYGLSFLILGVLWMMHHAVYDNVRFSNSTLGWLNIFSLLFVALIPFSTSLIWKHGMNQTTALAYGMNFLGAAALLWLMFCYASSRPDLVRPETPRGVLLAGRRMGFVYSTILLTAIGLAFVAPIASFAMYAAFVMTFIIFTAFGRFDVVMLWPARRRGRGARGRD